MPTALGWTLITMPTTPPPASIEFSAVEAVAASTSPFTGQQQIQSWQAGWLEATVKMPSLAFVNGPVWKAFLMAAQGTANVFQLGDPVITAPQAGLGTGSMTVNGGGQTGYTLSVTGYTGTLSPGDWLQIGYRLYSFVGGVTVLTGGVAALPIWPQIRESPAGGAAIVLANTQGLFRLKTNTRKWIQSPGKMFGTQFDIREAL